MNNIQLIDFISKFNSENSAYWYGTIAGQKASASLLASKTAQYPSHYTSDRYSRYQQDINKKKYVTDCSGLIKGALMSTAAGVPVYNAKYDLNSEALINKSTNKGDIKTLPEVKGIGLWRQGHVAIYLGGGRYIEAAGFSAGIRTGTNLASFKKWFFIPYIDYIAEDNHADQRILTEEIIDQLAKEVIKGKFDNYPIRRDLLNNLGYGDIYNIIQTRVNQLLKG